MTVTMATMMIDTMPTTLSATRRPVAMARLAGQSFVESEGRRFLACRNPDPHQFTACLRSTAAPPEREHRRGTSEEKENRPPNEVLDGSSC
ncbi:hypothetical protein [Mesorhizobium sp. B2-4-17]|uniref:hypothetical protein n=1 Tax=Mesorhizobium sp. B2-4-17 TaxID=2589932 RepID=UPI0011291539|nr:hypothetical protein [Mesorhizobium sp. B2-4-17]TPK85484.1 hypothetical protein FJ548_16830 [Mesorhizobium sp. B2-4-17]